jgi:hypothetical protein
MPQASDEERARWGIGEDRALSVLERAGYRLTSEWTWVKPAGHNATEEEVSAIYFLIHEWDFGGLEPSV